VVQPVTLHPSFRKQGSGVRLHKGGHYLPRKQLLHWDCILEWSTRPPGIIYNFVAKVWVRSNRHNSLPQTLDSISLVTCNSGIQWRNKFLTTWVKHGSLGQDHSRVPCNTGWKSSFCLQTASHGIWSLCFSWIVQIPHPVVIWVFCSGESALKSSHRLPQWEEPHRLPQWEEPHREGDAYVWST
jgi:hypothetical protein